MSYTPDLSTNASGYRDSTALHAIAKADLEAKSKKKAVDGDGKPYDRPYDPDEAKFYKLLKTMFAMAECAGYRVESRIVLRDKKTGKVWK
ncbi:MAG: hypothetical protein LIP10_03565 [Clostridiales bacterium]|nr:hypothetical protein [Clostridiales bacterium]